MIQLAHVATGALVGRHARGSLDALLAGIAMHAAIDVIPHGEVHDEYLEMVTGAAGVLALATRYGWTSPITIGAIGGVMPDLEHLPQGIGRHVALFPTHRFAWLHGWEWKPLAAPAWLQAIVGGAVIGAFAAQLRRRATD
ncbi:MAG: hypothetical protein JWM86_658 [Thermoleophilia bacterium]|nr:hypothetical protein [Thermoleophilia bacterium]